MRRWIVALFAVSRLLVFSLPHAFGCGRPNEDEVRNPGRKHRDKRHQHLQPVPWFKNTPYAGRACSNGRTLGGKGQGEDDREGSLHGEIGGKDRRLEGCKLSSGENSECCHPANEGLKDLSSQEYTIAAGMSVYWVEGSRGASLT